MAAEPLDHLNAALTGRYVVERALGSGGMATVFVARDLRHDRPVALKILRPEVAAALGPDRFLREIALVARLHHPHILPLYDSGELVDPRPGNEGATTLFFVMPLVTGESLRQRIDRERQLPIDDALRITRQVAAALEYAHGQGVIHRDVKPENILLHEGQALIADFGIALTPAGTMGDRLTTPGVVVGTPVYMSPEQAVGEWALDP
ncbi:MAG TPA: serine/threonine-protein kinase, partial [Gemmatimonadaceae bacterium]